MGKHLNPREATAHLMNSRSWVPETGVVPGLLLWGFSHPLNPGSSAYNQAVVWGTSNHALHRCHSPPDCTSLVCSGHSVTPLGAY